MEKANASIPISLNDNGSFSSFIEVPQKDLSPMVLTLSFSVTEIRPLQPSKTSLFKKSTFLGIRIVFKLVHFLKAALPINDKLSGNTTSAKSSSSSNADSPIDSIVLGNDIDCKFL